jgi:copper chaperone CopZ
MKEIKLEISGMHCHSCEILVQDALEDIGAKITEISFQKGHVSVEFDEKKLGRPEIVAAIRKEGYTVIG